MDGLCTCTRTLTTRGTDVLSVTDEGCAMHAPEKWEEVRARRAGILAEVTFERDPNTPYWCIIRTKDLNGKHAWERVTIEKAAARYDQLREKMLAPPGLTVGAERKTRGSR